MNPKSIIQMTGILAVCILLSGGCTMISSDRVFPKPVWYWSDAAKEQRAQQELYKQYEKIDENWTDDTNELELSYQIIMLNKAQRAGITNQPSNIK